MFEPTEFMVKMVKDQIRDLIEKGMTADEAIKRIESEDLGPMRSAMELARVEIIREYLNPSPFENDPQIATAEVQKGRWISSKEQRFETYWPYLRNNLREDLGDALDSVDKSSTQVLQSLRPPREPNFNIRGLVLGYVQSGKTTNFMSLIAKAADVGYRLIVVLAGITNNLRFQTQERFEEKLIASEADSNARWIKLTGLDFDFGQGQIKSQVGNAATILKDPKNRIIAVVKKNSTVLRNLNKFIDESGIAQIVPMLIIDDEADQASINVSSHDKNEQSAINAAICQLLRNRKTAYVAYTATPFANLLIDPNTEDLYPKDFIHVLPKPKGHFGTEDLFGRGPLFGEDLVDSDGIDMIHTIDEDEVAEVRASKRQREEGWQMTVPDSLRKSILWFLLACAARRARGQEQKHMSMLVHTTVSVADHQNLADLIRQDLRLVKREFKTGQNHQVLRELWENESQKVPAESFNLDPIEFERILDQLPEVFDALKIVEDNGQSVDRLNYDNEPQTVIAVGGNTLARGLTLEGLMCSYFVRNATAYDTLLQMGRWFGFRNGYQDLPRIWMTEELQGWFQDLALVEADLREELSFYAQSGTTPLEYQAKIRTHPAMMVTSRAKQQDARATDISYSRQKPQTILFHHKDKEWLNNNIDATRTLVSRLQELGIPIDDKTNGTFVARGVQPEVILEFLDQYKFVEQSHLGRDNAAALKKYIEKETESGSIKIWNISFYGRKPSKKALVDGVVEVGLDQPLRTLNRSQMVNSTPETANIKTLVGPMDRLNDVSWPTSDGLKEFTANLGSGYGREYAIVQKHAELVGGDVGHLAIYAVDKDSITTQPEDYVRKSGKKAGEKIDIRYRRKDLCAVEHAIGVGIFFPESRNAKSEVEYVSATDYIRDPDEVEMLELMLEEEAERTETSETSGSLSS